MIGVTRTGQADGLSQKREVMCMEQISYFLAEYSGWVIVGFGVLVTMLLAVTLRRIKKLGKRIDTLARSICPNREVWAGFEEADSKNMVGEETLELRKEDKKGTEGGKSQMKETSGEMQREMGPDELLNAILDEVFP